ncbi:hypothetical protein, partial [Bacillus toyonensis]|uniref:hypothetical protein n=1 Tax=Bacillus toyonensis TaxID=155322 RepID=UPI002E1D612D|nr:hypothetical protein [Bacillus toyonensis]
FLLSIFSSPYLFVWTLFVFQDLNGFGALFSFVIEESDRSFLSPSANKLDLITIYLAIFR